MKNYKIIVKEALTNDMNFLPDLILIYYNDASNDGLKSLKNIHSLPSSFRNTKLLYLQNYQQKNIKIKHMTIFLINI